MTSEVQSRASYDPAFLGRTVAVPEADPAIADDLVQLNGTPVVPYQHFSLALSRSRRLARWVAWNIDGARLFDGDSIPREGIDFRFDPRLPTEVQTGDEVYDRNRLDRGHIARRADLLWGTRAEADAANHDSFYFPNITPQMDNFNQSGKNGVWGLLENALLAQVNLDRQRVAVLGGPVLAADDPLYRGVLVPREFWKVLVYVMDGQLTSRAFLVTQSLDGLSLLPLDEFNTYLIPLAQLELRIQLRFDAGLHVAVASDAAVRAVNEPTLVRDVAQIVW